MPSSLSSRLLLIPQELEELDVLYNSVIPEVSICTYSSRGTATDLLEKIAAVTQKHLTFLSIGLMAHGNLNRIHLTHDLSITPSTLESAPTKLLITDLKELLGPDGQLDIIACEVSSRSIVVQELEERLQRRCYTSSGPLGGKLWQIERGEPLERVDLIGRYFTATITEWNHLLLSASSTGQISSYAPYFDGKTTSCTLKPPKSYTSFDLSSMKISLDTFLAPVRDSSLYDPLGNTRLEWQTLFEFGYADGVLNTALELDPISKQALIRQGPISSAIETPTYLQYFDLSSITFSAPHNLFFDLQAKTLKLNNAAVTSTLTSGTFLSSSSYKYPLFSLGASLSKTERRYFHGKIDNFAISGSSPPLTVRLYWNNIGAPISNFFQCTTQPLSPKIYYNEASYRCIDGYSPIVQNLCGELTLLEKLLTTPLSFTTIATNSTTPSIVSDPDHSYFKATFSNAVEINRLCGTNGRLFDYSPLLFDSGIYNTLSFLAGTIMTTYRFPAFSQYGLFDDTTSAATPLYPNSAAGHLDNQNFMKGLEEFYTPYGTETYSKGVLASLEIIKAIPNLLQTTQAPNGTTTLTQRLTLSGHPSIIQTISEGAISGERVMQREITLISENLSKTKKILQTLRSLANVFSDSEITLSRNQTLRVDITSYDGSQSFLGAGDEWIACNETILTDVFIPIRRVHMPLYAYCVMLNVPNAPATFSNNSCFKFLNHTATITNGYQQLETHLREISANSCSYYQSLYTLISGTSSPSTYPPHVSLKDAITCLGLISGTTLPALPTPNLPDALCNPFSGTSSWEKVETTFDTFWFFNQTYTGELAAAGLTPYAAASTTSQSVASGICNTNSFMKIDAPLAFLNQAAYIDYNRLIWLCKWFEDPQTISTIQSIISSLSTLQEKEQNEVRLKTSNYSDHMQTLGNYSSKGFSIVKKITDAL
jgi:hypothetical protein